MMVTSENCLHLDYSNMVEVNVILNNLGKPLDSQGRRKEDNPADSPRRRIQRPIRIDYYRAAMVEQFRLDTMEKLRITQ